MTLIAEAAASHAKPLANIARPSITRLTKNANAVAAATLQRDSERNHAVAGKTLAEKMDGECERYRAAPEEPKEQRVRVRPPAEPVAHDHRQERHEHDPEHEVGGAADQRCAHGRRLAREL